MNSIEKLKSIPQDKEVVWDFWHTPIQKIFNDLEGLDGSVVFWGSNTDQSLRRFDLIPEQKMSDSLPKSLVRAILKPFGDNQCVRPGKIVFHDRQIQLLFKGVLNRLDIEMGFSGERSFLQNYQSELDRHGTEQQAINMNMVSEIEEAGIGDIIDDFYDEMFPVIDDLRPKMGSLELIKIPKEFFEFLPAKSAYFLPGDLKGNKKNIQSVLINCSKAAATRIVKTIESGRGIEAICCAKGLTDEAENGIAEEKILLLKTRDDRKFVIEVSRYEGIGYQLEKAADSGVIGLIVCTVPEIELTEYIFAEHVHAVYLSRFLAQPDLTLWSQ